MWAVSQVGEIGLEPQGPGVEHHGLEAH